MVLFIPIKQQLYSPDIGRYSSYGISAVTYVAGTFRKSAFVADVSVSLRETVLLAWQCTAGQLDPMQLQDAVEDYICK